MPAVGQFTGEIVKRTRPLTYNGVVEDLARDIPADRIARSRRVSDNTVVAIREREADLIADKKKTLAAMFDTLCERSIRRANKTVKTATYAQACVGAGISAQRAMELRGELQSDRGLTINLLNLTGGSA
jgi:hypothetical protein